MGLRIWPDGLQNHSFPKASWLIWSFAVMCGPWNIMEQQKKTLHTVHMQPCQIAIPQLLHINSKMVEKNDHPHKTLAQPAWAISRRMYRSSSTLLASTQPITCMAHLLSCWTKTSSWGQVMHGKKKPKKTAHTNNKHQHHHHQQQQQQPPCTTKNGAIKKSTVDLLSSIEASKESESPVMSSSTM